MTFVNFLWATLVFWLGGFGLFLARIVKNNWTGIGWTYIPVFWVPVLGSWPASIAVLFGGLDGGK
jgi:hypothetical protein